MVDITSEPVGASIFLDGRLVGITPARILMDKRQPARVLRLEKEGHAPAELQVKRSLSGWVPANVGFMAYAATPSGFGDNPQSRAARVAIGLGLTTAALAVDYANGAAYSLPSRLHATLTPRR